MVWNMHMPFHWHQPSFKLYNACQHCLGYIGQVDTLIYVFWVNAKCIAPYTVAAWRLESCICRQNKTSRKSKVLVLQLVRMCINIVRFIPCMFDFPNIDASYISWYKYIYIYFQIVIPFSSATPHVKGFMNLILTVEHTYIFQAGKVACAILVCDRQLQWKQ